MKLKTALIKVWAISACAITFGVIFFLFAYIFVNGAEAITWEFLTESPKGMIIGTEGGILPAIVGSASYTGIACLFGAILGICTAIYQVYYCKNERISGGIALVMGAEGDGIGEWILLATADGSQMELYAIDFMLGYHKSENLLQQNGAPTSILLEFEDGTQQTAENLFDMDVVVLEKPVKTSWVKITILDARRGTVYTDTCISDIELFGLASE